MARPLSFPYDMWLEAFALFKQELGYRRIRQALVAAYGEANAPSERTVARMVSRFRHLSADFARLENPWRWVDSAVVGIPWGEGRYLLDVIRATKTLEVFPNEIFPEYRAEDEPRMVPPLTVREASWLWRLHRVASELDLFDAFWLTQWCCTRERAHAILRRGDEPVAFEDLEGLLAFAPWRSREACSRYLRATECGHVARLRLVQQHTQAGQAGVVWGADGTRSTHTNGSTVRGGKRPPSDYGLRAILVPFKNEWLERIRRVALGLEMG